MDSGKLGRLVGSTASCLRCRNLRHAPLERKRFCRHRANQNVAKHNECNALGRKTSEATTLCPPFLRRTIHGTSGSQTCASICSEERARLASAIAFAVACVNAELGWRGFQVTTVRHTASYWRDSFPKRDDGFIAWFRLIWGHYRSASRRFVSRLGIHNSGGRISDMDKEGSATFLGLLLRRAAASFSRQHVNRREEFQRRCVMCADFHVQTLFDAFSSFDFSTSLHLSTYIFSLNTHTSTLALSSLPFKHLLLLLFLHSVLSLKNLSSTFLSGNPSVHSLHPWSFSNSTCRPLAAPAPRPTGLWRPIVPPRRRLLSTATTTRPSSATE